MSWTWDWWAYEWLFVEVESCFMIREQVLGFESVGFLPFGNSILCERELRYGLFGRMQSPDSGPDESEARSFVRCLLITAFASSGLQRKCCGDWGFCERCV